MPKVPFTVSSMKPAKEALEEAHLSKLRTDYFDFRTKSGHGDVGFFLIGRNAAGALELASLAAYESLRKTSDEVGLFLAFRLPFLVSAYVTVEQVLLGFVDPSALPQNPGWPLRNFLTFARKAWNMEKTTVLCFRDLYDRPDMAESVVCEVEMPEPFGGGFVCYSMNFLSLMPFPDLQTSVLSWSDGSAMPKDNLARVSSIWARSWTRPDSWTLPWT